MAEFNTINIGATLSELAPTILDLMSRNFEAIGVIKTDDVGITTLDKSPITYNAMIAIPSYPFNSPFGFNPILDIQNKEFEAIGVIKVNSIGITTLDKSPITYNAMIAIPSYPFHSPFGFNPILDIQNKEFEAIGNMSINSTNTPIQGNAQIVGIMIPPNIYL